MNETNYELFNIDGYQVPVQYYRSDRRGGGIMLYMKNNLEFKPRNDIVINDGCTESLFIEIEKEMFSALKNIIIGVIYRPPNSNMDNFNIALETTLNYLKGENRVMYLLGDYNIDLLKEDSHSQTSEFENLLYSHGLFPLITKPTRVPVNSATLIDNIFTNNFVDTDQHYQGIFYNDISDHFPVFHVNKQNDN